MTIVHVCDGWERWNGAAQVARMLADEQASAGHRVCERRYASWRELRTADEVWVHCGWKPCLWWAVFAATAFFPAQARRPRVRWLTAGCHDPVRLRYHGWKKTLAGPIERFFLRRCDALGVTCEAEGEWNRAYLGKRCPEIEIVDVVRMIRAEKPIVQPRAVREKRPLRILFLGRRHPLKGLAFLEAAVRQINEGGGAVSMKTPCVELRIESRLEGDDLDKAWEWCDLLCLPTLSDNLGLVVAEAFAKGRPVITTDGAPAWSGIASEQGRYLVGYRDGDEEARVRLLKEAIGGYL